MHSFDMRPFRVDDNYIPPEPDHVTQLCFDALETLGGHMDVGAYMPDVPAGLEEVDAQEAEDIELDENVLTVHYTQLVPLSHDRAACLTNVVYLADEDGALQPWHEPGYVVLRTQPVVPEPDTYVLRQEPGVGQLIFRMPMPELDEAAIFIGFTLRETARVEADDTQTLKKIERTLYCIRIALRELNTSDPFAYRQTYHAEKPCISSAARFISQFDMPPED